MLKQPEHSHRRIPSEQDSHDLLRSSQELKNMSRRNLIKLGAVAAFALTDMVYTKEIQHERNYVDVKMISDSETYQQFPQSSWLVFPGFKMSWEDADHIAQALEPTMKTRGQIARLGYSNTGFDMDEIYQATRLHIQKNNLNELFLYGHSFGGMTALEIAARLKTDKVPVDVKLIALDSSPHSRDDVKDQAMFEGIVSTYSPDYLMPTSVRASFEFGERVVHKNERTWQTVINQTLGELLPTAPSNQLIETEAVDIYNFRAKKYGNSLDPQTKLAYIGNPEDDTIDFWQAVDGWRSIAPNNFMSSPYLTLRTLPPHASPQFNATIYNTQLAEIQHYVLPLPRRESHHHQQYT